ncbi:hypothetical protein D9M73_194590 [compost metagenome]
MPWSGFPRLDFGQAHGIGLVGRFSALHIQDGATGCGCFRKAGLRPLAWRHRLRIGRHPAHGCPHQVVGADGGVLLLVGPDFTLWCRRCRLRLDRCARLKLRRRVPLEIGDGTARLLRIIHRHFPWRRGLYGGLVNGRQPAPDVHVSRYRGRGARRGCRRRDRNRGLHGQFQGRTRGGRGRLGEEAAGAHQGGEVVAHHDASIRAR